MVGVFDIRRVVSCLRRYFTIQTAVLMPRLRRTRLLAVTVTTGGVLLKVIRCMQHVISLNDSASPLPVHYYKPSSQPNQINMKFLKATKPHKNRNVNAGVVSSPSKLVRPNPSCSTRSF